MPRKADKFGRCSWVGGNFFGTYIDDHGRMAGAFTLVGCAAAILGEIEPIIEFIRPSGAPEQNE